MAEDVRITARVQRGAAYLDREQPGWIDRIDLITLNVGSACRCLLGQLHGGDFDAALESNAVPGNTMRDAEAWATEHGFLAEAELRGDARALVDAEYAELTLAWTDLIERRIGERIAAGVTSDGA